MSKLTFFFLRLPVAVSLAGHGLVRLPRLGAFSYLLPVAETIIGTALLVGLKPAVSTLY